MRLQGSKERGTVIQMKWEGENEISHTISCLDRYKNGKCTRNLGTQQKNSQTIALLCVKNTNTDTYMYVC